jgi:hypothetical protein
MEASRGHIHATAKAHGTTLTRPPTCFNHSFTLLQEPLFSMLKANMEAWYRGSSWGWKDRAKRAELFEREARYLVAVGPGQGDEAGPPLAFVHLRFLVDDDGERGWGCAGVNTGWGVLHDTGG